MELKLKVTERVILATMAFVSSVISYIYLH